MMFPKHKPTRVYGEALRGLVAEVTERDKHCCIVCGRWVEEGVKPHHEPPGNGRKCDTLDHMVLLCNECHFERHNGRNSRKIEKRCREYLTGLYGGTGHGILN